MDKRAFVTQILAVLALALGGALALPSGAAAAGSPEFEALAAGRAAIEARLPELKLPPGFRIDVVSAEVPGARSLARGAKGTLFVSTRTTGVVYAVTDRNGDWRADEVRTIARGLYAPNGIALRDGALYVAEINQIQRFDDIENHLDHPPKPILISNSFPSEGAHGWKFIRFGPDGRLYVPIGSPCNICRPEDPFGTIARLNPDGSGFEIYARGVRNSVGFDWHPETKELWFTDNGRDMMGDDLPPDELNRAPTAGLNFGFPFCHGGSVLDPNYGNLGDCERFAPPAQKLGPHVAALGMRFYTGAMFPAAYRNQIFIAEHGSWNRSEPIGYRIMLVVLDASGKALSYEPFIEGWLGPEGAWGRPVDLEVMPDGSLLISDDLAGVVYRVSYGD